jgi:hypothetical protein
MRTKRGVSRPYTQRQSPRWQRSTARLTECEPVHAGGTPPVRQQRFGVPVVVRQSSVTAFEIASDVS